MEIIGKKIPPEKFFAYLKTVKFGSIRPSEIVLHHTWRPTAQSWRGERSIGGLKNHYENLGWSAAPHIFVASDGIWAFFDLAKVGIHAGAGNATWEKNGEISHGFTPPKGGTLVKYSIGLEVVGNYNHQVWSGQTKENAVGCLRDLLDFFEMGREKIFFHRDFSSKSCPGSAISKDWVWRQLQKCPPKSKCVFGP